MQHVCPAMFIIRNIFFSGKPCTVNLYNNFKSKATFVCSTGAYSHIAVEDLHTPIGIVSSALLRTKDIQSIEVEIGNEYYLVFFECLLIFFFF